MPVDPRRLLQDDEIPITMKLENTFITPPLISLRDGVKKLTSLLESRPKPPANITPEQQALLERFHDYQVRLGAVLEAYEMEIDNMIKYL